MAKVITDSKHYTDIAEFIKKRLGVTKQYYPSEMRSALDSIPERYEENIFYGDEAPEDTSKLFIKGAKPDKLLISSTFSGGNELKNNIGLLPSGIAGIGVASIGSKVYLFGGYTKEAYLNTIRVFDTVNNTLETLSVTIPKKLANMGVAVVGSDIYLFGGYSGSASTSIYKFSTATNEIAQVATLSTALSSMGVAVMGSLVYLFGGCNSNPFDVTTDGSSKSVYRFDATNNAITTLTTEIYTGGVFGIAVATVGTKAYLFGGRRNTSNILKSVSVFDMETETITSLGDCLPYSVFGMSAVGFDNKVYLFGGQISENSSMSYSDDILLFDVNTKTSEVLPVTLEKSTMYIGTTLVNKSVYLFGGVRSTYLDSINQYVIVSDLPKNTIVIKNTDTGTPCRIIDESDLSIEISIDKIYRGNNNNIAKVETAYLYINDSWELVSGTE